MKFGGGLILLAAASASAQTDEPPLIDYPPLPLVVSGIEGFALPGWVVAAKAEGDLNRDGRADLALALWTEAASRAEGYEEIRNTPPYRLVIAFARPNGGYRLIADNKTLLVPPAYSGTYEGGLDGDSLRIVRGSLDISRDLLRGHYRYRFRWSENAFRLVGYEYGGSDGACITLASINYLTRRAKLEAMPISEDNSRAVVRSVKRGPLATLDQVSSLDFLASGMGVIGNWPDCPRTEE